MNKDERKSMYEFTYEQHLTPVLNDVPLMRANIHHTYINKWLMCSHSLYLHEEDCLEHPQMCPHG